MQLTIHVKIATTFTKTSRALNAFYGLEEFFGTVKFKLFDISIFTISIFFHKLISVEIVRVRCQASGKLAKEGRRDISRDEQREQRSNAETRCHTKQRVCLTSDIRCPAYWAGARQAWRFVDATKYIEFFLKMLTPELPSTLFFINIRFKIPDRPFSSLFVYPWKRLWNFVFKEWIFSLFPVNEFPVLKADSIKFVMSFRSVLPRELVVGSIPHLIRHLSATSTVVHSYAACAIEKILALKDANNVPM